MFKGAIFNVKIQLLAKAVDENSISYCLSTLFAQNEMMVLVESTHNMRTK